MTITTMPEMRERLSDEHHHLRHDRGIVDWRGAGVFDVTGPGAVAFLDAVCTRSVAFLVEERILSALLLDDDAGVIAAIDVLCRAGGYTVLVWPEQRDAAWSRLAERAGGRADVQVSDRSDAIAVLAVEGPNSGAAVEAFLDGDAGQIRYKTFASSPAMAEEMVVARIGVTAEFGYTLLCPAAEENALRDQLRRLGVPACGREAVDVCRMETRFVNLEKERPRPRTTPFELGLQWMVDASHDFTARQALAERRASETFRLPVCFTAAAAQPPNAGDEVLAAGRSIGQVTHALWSPGLQRILGVAHLDADLAAPGLDLRACSMDGDVAISTCSGPFLVPTSIAARQR